MQASEGEQISALVDGERISGTVIGTEGSVYVVDVGNGEREIPFDAI